MASYQSIPAQMPQVQQPMDVDFMGKVLMAKEGQTNANIAQIDETLGQLKIQENMLIGDQRKARFANNVQTLLDEVNKSGKLNLQSGDFTRRMKNYVTTALDDYTLDHIAKANNIRAFQADVAEKKKKGDGSYNDLNYSYSAYKGGLQEYVNEQTDNLNGLSYVDYYDDAKEFKDFAENLDKYDNEIEKSSNATQDGYIYTQKGKRLSESEIRNKITALLSDKAKKQMKVNAWGTYEQGATEEERTQNTLSNFSTFKTDELAKIDANIVKAELDVKNGTLTKEELDNYKNYKKELEKQYTSWENNPTQARETMANTMYTNKKIDSFAKAFAFDNVRETIASDATFIHKQDMAYKAQQDAWDRDYKTKQLKLEQYKAGVTTDENGNIIATSDIQQKADPNYAPDSEAENLVDKQNERVQGYEPIIKQASNTIMQSIDDETRKLVEARVEASKGKLSVEDVLIELGETNHQIVSAKGFKELSEARMDKALEQEVITKYTKQVQETQNKILDTDSAIEEMYNNPNVKMMWKGKDGKERLFSVKEVMLANSIVDKNGKKLKGISEVKPVFEALKKSMLADKIISNKSGLSTYGNMKNLAMSMGEDIDKIYKKSGTQTYSGSGLTMGTSGTISDVYKLDPNSKTAMFIEEHTKKGGYDKTWSNDSFDDLSSATTYFKAISPETIKKEVGKLLQKDETLAIGKMNMIAPKTPSFKAIQGLVSDQLDESTSVSITPIPNQPNMVQITQKGYTNASGKTTPTITEQVRIEDLPQSITNQIDLKYKRNIMTVKNVPTVETPVNYRTEIDKSALKDITETHFKGNKQEALKTYRSGALDYLFSLNPNVMGTVAKPTEIGTKVINIIDSQPTVGLKKGHSNDIYPTISLKGKEVWVSDDWYTDNNLKQIYNIKTYTPQIVINNWLAEIITNPNYETKLKEVYGE